MPTSTVSTSSVSTAYAPGSINSVDTTSESISHYTNLIKYIRSRNVSFDTTRLKSITRFYAFFQGIDINKYIIPKLLEVTMVSGKFQAGETVVSDPNFTSAKISFRLCTPNHKAGPYNSPLDTFSLLPYNQQPPPTNYSESSTFLNVDIRSLELPSEVNFYGQIAPNMTLIGKTSGAVAKISNIRLVSDNFGRLIGSFFIPDPNIPENPMWINGANTFTLTDSSTLAISPDASDVGGTLINQSSATATFTSSGILNLSDKNILTTRNTTIYSGYNTNTTTITNTSTNYSTNSGGGGSVGGGAPTGGGGTVEQPQLPVQPEPTNLGTINLNFGVKVVDTNAAASLKSLWASVGASDADCN